MLFESIGFPVAVMAIIAGILGLVITLIFKLFETKVDERVQEVTEALPGANCGACGFSGCAGYAEALCDGSVTDTTRCSVGGSDTAQEIASILGVETGSFEKKVAQVLCQGTCNHTKPRYKYTGTPTCAAANIVQQGPGSCIYGCLGFGDCKVACQYEAIEIIDGVARINKDRCVACNQCVLACPKKIIEMIPFKEETYQVRCSNPLSGAFVRPTCSIGCIGCQRCLKACQYEAISMKGDLAYIDQKKCVSCGECIKVCPTKSITYGLEMSS